MTFLKTSRYKSIVLIIAIIIAIGAICFVSILLPKPAILSNEARDSIDMLNVWNHYENLSKLGYSMNETEDVIVLSKPLIDPKSKLGGGCRIQIYRNVKSPDNSYDVLEYSNRAVEHVSSNESHQKTNIYINRVEIQSDIVHITLREDAISQDSTLLSDELISIMKAVQ